MFVACGAEGERVSSGFAEFVALAVEADTVYTDGAYFPRVPPELGRAGWAAVWACSVTRRIVGHVPGPLWNPLEQAAGAALWAALHATLEVVFRSTRVVSDYTWLVDACIDAKQGLVTLRALGKMRHGGLAAAIFSSYNWR